MAELVDALASGASALMGVEVRVLSWAPIPSEFQALRHKETGLSGRFFAFWDTADFGAAIKEVPPAQFSDLTREFQQISATDWLVLAKQLFLPLPSIRIQDLQLFLISFVGVQDC